MERLTAWFHPSWPLYPPVTPPAPRGLKPGEIKPQLWADGQRQQWSFQGLGPQQGHPRPLHPQCSKGLPKGHSPAAVSPSGCLNPGSSPCPRSRGLTGPGLGTKRQAQPLSRRRRTLSEVNLLLPRVAVPNSSLNAQRPEPRLPVPADTQMFQRQTAALGSTHRPVQPERADGKCPAAPYLPEKLLVIRHASQLEHESAY